MDNILLNSLVNDKQEMIDISSMTGRKDINNNYTFSQEISNISSVENFKAISLPYFSTGVGGYDSTADIDSVMAPYEKCSRLGKCYKS